MLSLTKNEKTLVCLDPPPFFFPRSRTPTIQAFRLTKKGILFPLSGSVVHEGVAAINSSEFFSTTGVRYSLNKKISAAEDQSVLGMPVCITSSADIVSPRVRSFPHVETRILLYRRRKASFYAYLIKSKQCIILQHFFLYSLHRISPTPTPTNPVLATNYVLTRFL